MLQRRDVAGPTRLLWQRSTESVVFGLATTVLVGHILMDAVAAPEPGTRASEHIVPAIVPIGIAALAVGLYPRLRAGARASVALVFGVFALVGAALAISHAVAVAPRGDDWSGFLLIPAGLALCTLGGRILWRSRNPGGRRHLRRTLLLLAAALGVYWLVLPVAIAIVATHRPREAVGGLALGRPYQDVQIRTRDALDLHGRYVPSRNRGAVIIFPADVSRTPHARMLARHGYGVLLLEMRGFGRSDGDPNAFGWGATTDIDAAVAFLRGRADVDRMSIGGLGFSVGGEQMLEAAAGNPALRAVVSEGAGIRSVREAAHYGARGWLSLPMYAVQTAAVSVLSGAAPPPSLTDIVPRIAPTPILLIYAAKGQGGEDLNPLFHRAARNPKSVWRVDGGHTMGLSTAPTEYERRVVGFFNRALLD